MKQWKEPKMMELKVSETAYEWIGVYRDGGYVGDGVLSGHLTCEQPTHNPCSPKPTNNPVQPLS